MKGTYRALGIVAVVALLGGILETVLYAYQVIGYGVDYLPPWSSVPGVDIFYYGRTFTALVALDAVVLVSFVAATFAVIVAAQSRRVGWLITLTVMALICLVVPPYVPFIAFFILGIPADRVNAIIANAEWQSALAIAFQLIVIAFVLTGSRVRSHLKVAAPALAEVD